VKTGYFGIGVYHVKTVLGDGPEDVHERTARLCKRWPDSYLLCELPRLYMKPSLEVCNGA